MLLKDLLDDLIYNELNNVVVGKPEWDTGKFSYNNLIRSISLGVTEIYKRFALSKETVQVNPVNASGIYVLDYKYAASNTASLENKFILDSADQPFSGRVAKIDSLYDADGNFYEFDTTITHSGLFTRDYRTLVIKDSAIVAPVSVMIRSMPPPITVDESNFESFDIDLSEVYREALILYAAGRVMSGRGPENATNNESAIFFARFENSCAVIMHTGLDNREHNVNNKLHSRGFV